MPCHVDFALVKTSSKIVDAAIIKKPAFAFSKAAMKNGGGLLLDTKGLCVFASSELVARIRTTREALLGDGWKRHLSDESMRTIQTTWASSCLECVFMRYVRLQPRAGNNSVLLSFRPSYRLDGTLAGYLGLAKIMVIARSKPVRRQVG